MRLRTLFQALALAFFAAPGLADEAAMRETYVAVGYGGRHLTSRDGVNWKDLNQGSGASERGSDFYDVVFGGDRFLAVGGSAARGFILSGRGLDDWRTVHSTEAAVETISFGRGRSVAAQGSRLLFSIDGQNFRDGPQFGSGTWVVRARHSASGDTEAGFRFVFVGEARKTPGEDSIPWRGVTGDGTRVEHETIETAAARDVAYGSGHFVVVGPGGLIESSHDGQTWMRHRTESAGDFTRVVWTGRRFVAAGDAVWTSPDGMAWQRESFRVPGVLLWAREGGPAIAASRSGELSISTDWATWKRSPVPAGPAIMAIAVGKTANP